MRAFVYGVYGVYGREFKKSRHSIKKKLEMVGKLEKKLKRDSTASSSITHREETEKLTGNVSKCSEKRLA